MAVLTEVPGLKVEVIVDDEPLKEYDDEQPAPPKTVSKYVEAKSDARFRICYSFTPPFPNSRAILVRLFVDGIVMRTIYHHGACLGEKLFKNHHILFSQSFADGKWFEQDFRFSQLVIGKKS